MPEPFDPTKLTAEPQPPQLRSAPVFRLFLFLYVLTIAAQLVSLAFGRIDESSNFASIAFPSALFLSLITIPSIWIGLILGRQVGLGSPLFGGLLSGDAGCFREFVRQAGLAAILGIAVGALLLLIRQFSAPYLPPEVPAFGHRGVIGGLAVSFGAAVGEEIWFRLGLMTLLVWCGSRLFSDRKPRSGMVWIIIVVSAVAFGAAHLPQLLSYGAGSPFAIGGTILGNTAVGTLYGWCFWRKGLFAAMVAHFTVDLMIHVLPAFVG